MPYILLHVGDSGKKKRGGITVYILKRCTVLRDGGVRVRYTFMCICDACSKL